MREIIQLASADGEWGVLKFQLGTYGTNLVVTQQKKAFQRNHLIIIINQNRQPTQLWHLNFLFIFFCLYQMCCLFSVVHRCLTVIGAWRAASTAHFQSQNCFSFYWSSPFFLQPLKHCGVGGICSYIMLIFWLTHLTEKTYCWKSCQHFIGNGWNELQYWYSICQNWFHLFFCLLRMNSLRSAASLHTELLFWCLTYHMFQWGINCFCIFLCLLLNDLPKRHWKVQ